MSVLSAYATIERLGPMVTTAEAAVALGRSTSGATHFLRDLAAAGRAVRIRSGLWWLKPEPPDPFAIGSDLTRPYPAYVSMLSALNYRGLIDQLPREIALASLDRARKIETAIGTYRVSHLPPEAFGGWEATDRGPVATIEKAIFDLAYVGVVATGRPRAVPELDLPPTFERARTEEWLERIHSPRLRTMTLAGIGEILSRATH